MKFKPLHDMVVIKRDEAVTATAGGIILPDDARERPLSGVVLAVGPGKRGPSGALQPLQVQVGDRIWFPKFIGIDLTVEGQAVMLIEERHIIGVMEPENG